MAETTRARFRVHLRIRHPAMAPEAISKAFGFDPDIVYAKGDQHRAPDGRLLSFQDTQTLWLKTLIEFEDPPETATAVVAHLARRLENHERSLAGIRQSGGRVELFIGWFAHDNCGLSVPAELMGQLARLGIDLDFDLYPLAE